MTSVIAASPDQICPALTGTRIPNVRLTTADGDSFDLNAAVAKQRTVLVFIEAGGDRIATGSWANCERSSLS